VIPELVDAHVRALVSAAAQLRQQGRDPRPEIMVPLVADVAELALARRRVEVTLEQVAATRHTVTCPVGVMIELPRAALTAGALAAEAEFFSFGTNDLTQTTWGISRDDAEAGFLSSYREAGLLADDPFTRLDETGVGELIQIAVERGRAVRPDLGLGACGEHAGDPESIAFLGRAGLDYVSCSPPRVPVARLEAGRAAVSASATGDTR
jgi:pyruvate, orthophosphate dikinase